MKKYFPNILSLLLLLLPAPSTSTPTTLASDAAALAALKASVAPPSIPPWSCLASWNFSSDPCRPAVRSHFVCGLSCTATSPNAPLRVVGIALDPVGYAGSLAAVDFSNLTMLDVLDVASNAFYGPIPSSISSLPNLRTLVLSSNKFTGPIPQSLARLSSLQTIDLSRNALLGAIPDSLSALNNLNILDFSSNRLSGNLPRRLPPNLAELALRDNLLSGELMRSSLSKLKYLMVLELGLNKFSGNLGGWLFLLPSLQQLDMSNNTVRSLQVWPPKASSNLVAVDLGYNSINGTLPIGLASFPALAVLSVRYNRLTGSIPWQYYGAKKGTAFRRLFLDGNFLNGKVPEGFFGGDEMSGSFGDNCLLNCPAAVELCSPEQKPDWVCKQIYGTGKMN